MTDPSALFLAARSGDRAAGDALMRWLRPKVLAYCRKRLNGRHDAHPEDVAQEALTAIWVALPRYRHHGRPMSWVWEITSHKVADALRWAYRQERLIELHPPGEIPDRRDCARGPDELAVAGDIGRRVAPLLAGLPRAQREAVELAAFGLGNDAAAELLGVKPGTVRVRRCRGYAALRSGLAEAA